MKISNGKVKYCKFAETASCPDRNNGKREAINITITIIIPNAIRRYLNFNGNSPIITYYRRIIKER